MKTSVETCMIYELAVSTWSSVEKPLLVASLSLVHFLLSNCIRSIQNWILDSLNLHNWIIARFAESSFDFLVLLHIFWRIQLIEMHGRFITLWIFRLRSPVIWYLNTWKRVNKVFFSALVLGQNKDVLSSTLNWRMSLVRDSEHSKGTLGFLKY